MADIQKYSEQTFESIKHPQKEAKPSDTRCRGLGALSCSDFVEVNRIV